MMRTPHRTAILFCVAALSASAPLLAQKEAPRVLVLEAVVQGEGEYRLRWPVGVASGAADEIVVADAWGRRLVSFRENNGAWKPERVVELPGTPVGVAYDGSRYVVSLRGEAALVAVEQPKWLLRNLPLASGTVPGVVAGVVGGGLLVHDVARGEVLRLAGNGSVTGRTPLEGRATALAGGTGSDFYAAFARTGTVTRFDAEGNEIESWRVPGARPVPSWPTGLVVSATGEIVVVDRHGDRIVVLDVGGTLRGVGSRKGWEPGLLLFPAGICRLGDGRFAVAEQGNGRVQVFRRTEGSAGR